MQIKFSKRTEFFNPIEWEIRAKKSVLHRQQATLVEHDGKSGHFPSDLHFQVNQFGEKNSREAQVDLRLNFDANQLNHAHCKLFSYPLNPMYQTNYDFSCPML